jgi:ComF family protein
MQLCNYVTMLLSSLYDLLFPPHCLGCQSLGSYLCPECTNRFHPLKQAICPVCHRGSYQGHTHPSCRGAKTLDGLISTFPYQGIIKTAIMKYKYKLVSQLTQTIHELMITHTDFDPLYSQSWIIIPVPLHSRRLRWRGFNQAELLAQPLASYTGWPYHPHLIKRTRFTAPQMSLSRTPRQKNIIGAFTAQNSPFAPHQPILLIDDVWTTGSTLSECAKVVKQAGTKKVWALTLARTLNH